MKKSILKLQSIGNSLIMVEVNIWNIKKKKFNSMLITVDTGASITTISKKLLIRIGYNFDEREKSIITTASGVEHVSKTTIEKLQIGEFTLNDVEVYAHTFPEESFSLGVLGLNVLELFDIELLFSKRLIVFNEI